LLRVAYPLVPSRSKHVTGYIATEADHPLIAEIVNLHAHDRRIGVIVSTIPMLPEITSGSISWKTM